MVKVTNEAKYIWNSECIGSIFTFYANNTLSREYMVPEDGNIQNVHYGDILVKYGAILNCERDTVPYVRKDINISTTFLQNGDIVMADTAEDDTVGKVVEITNVGTRKLVSGLHTVFMRPRKDVFAPCFLGYFMNSKEFHDQLIPFITGIKVSSISRKCIKNIYVSYPSKSEQKAIAEALSDIDQLISATEKLIAKKQDIKKGLMQELLTGKRRLPGFTKEWCRLTLKEIGLFKKARGISRSNAQSGSIRAIRYGELYTLHDRYVVTYGSHISTQVASEATLVKRGDILFAASGETKEEIGKCAAIIDQGEIFAGGDIIVFTPSVATDPFFLGTVLNTENVIKQKAEKGQGDAVVHIHIPELEKISISIPSFEEQVAIGKIIFEFDSECLVLYKKLKKLHDIKQGMMSELLTGRIRLKEVKETGELNE